MTRVSLQANNQQRRLSKSKLLMGESEIRSYINAHVEDIEDVKRELIEIMEMLSFKTSIGADRNMKKKVTKQSFFRSNSNAS